MKDQPPPRSSSRLLTGVLSVPLRFKITIPYLVIAVLLAGVAAWLVSQSFARALQERFRSQLVDSATAADSSLFQLQSAQLAAARTIAATGGVADALETHAWDSLDEVVRPIAVNDHLLLVHLLDKNGLPVYGLRALPDGYAKNENASFASWLPVARVLRHETDSLGDKFVGIVDAPWGPALYTVAPIRRGNDLIGVVLVGMPLAQVLDAMQNGTPVNVTVYRSNGQAALSTAGGAAPQTLPASILQPLTQGQPNRLQSRSVTIGGTSNDEALSAMFLRGQASGWVVGVGWPRSTVTGQLSTTELAGWFTLGILVVIGLGLLVARAVAVPVAELVKASAEVAEGNFKVEVPEHAHDELGALAQSFNFMARELQQRELMHEVFGQTVSDDVREALVAGQVGMSGETKMVTVLFTDIRGFTSLAETYEPQQMVTLLNDYFEFVSAAVQKVGGFINKFGGDSTLAVFGAPLSADPQVTAFHALQAAFTIRTHLAEFNARQIEHKRPPMHIGIGINTGEAVAGTIGSRGSFEYTVIGDTVNTAARVQSLTNRFTDSNILITEDTRQALGKDAKLLVVDHGDVALKGKSKLVRVYGVVGMRFTQAEPVFQVGGIPRRDVLEALYLYCRGYSPRTIGQTKNIDPLVVHQWVDGAARLYERSSVELREEFGLTEPELKRLAANARRLAQMEPLADVEPAHPTNGNGTANSVGTAPLNGNSKSPTNGNGRDIGHGNGHSVAPPVTEKPTPQPPVRGQPK